MLGFPKDFEENVSMGSAVRALRCPDKEKTSNSGSKGDQQAL